MEHIVAVEGVGSQVEQGVFHPPQVPGQGRVVAPVAGHVGGEMQGQGVGEDEGQKGIQANDQQMSLPGRSGQAHVVSSRMADG